MKVLIAGRGKSGRSAYDYLKKQNVQVEFLKTSDLEKISFDSKYLDRLFSGLSYLVKSPGISFDTPIIKEAKKRKIKIVGEFELGACRLKGDSIAVTGTNGKTTTVSLIYFLLKNMDTGVFAGGNIGIPVTSFCDSSAWGDVSVLEVSSFQLEACLKYRPKIAAILNITPDHLNRHKSLKKYISCKLKITKNQTKNDYLLLNADDEILMENIPKTKAKIYYFSTKKRVVGCYVKSGYIYFNDNQKIKKIASVKNLKLVGEHNLSNVLCACLAVYLETENENLLKGLENFTAINHRIEFAGRCKKVDFYNDSKATNIDSTNVAIKSFKSKINLILGGSDKGYSFDEFFKNLPKNVKNIAIFGETKHKIAFSAKKFGFKNYFICEDLKTATVMLFEMAKPSEIVLLSPACASFDCFSNYEERGNFFKKIVKEICDETSRLNTQQET